MSVRVAPTQAPVPAAVKHPEPVKPEPEYTQQPVTTYEARLVEEDNYPTIIESLESEPNEAEAGYQSPQGPGPGQFITMDDLAETIQSNTPAPMPGSAAVENNFFGDMVDDFDDAFDAAFNPGLQRTE